MMSRIYFKIIQPPTSHLHKINSKRTTELNARVKPIKPLEDNLGVNLHDLGLGNDIC